MDSLIRPTLAYPAQARIARARVAVARLAPALFVRALRDVVRAWVPLHFLVLLVCLLPLPALAQMTATLVADQINVSAEGRLVASGNVEAFYAGTRLTASAISYDRTGDYLEIIGPIFITDPDGTILVADRAELDRRFENGLLRGARLVLDRQLQLAANRIDRSDGRFSQLTQVAATSCSVCGTRAPLWEIRAGRVTHDSAEQQLYFDDAVFHIRGVPVIWVPHMRLPDPSLDRATGLLIPELRSSDQLGVGLALPYFIRLGDSRDLRLIPYLSPRTATLEAIYRQAFQRGAVEIDAALSRDDLREGWRGRLALRGLVQLDYGLRLDFDLLSVSDPAYLLDYDLSDQDRIASRLRLTRIAADRLFAADLTAWQSLREGETAASLPPLIGGLTWEGRRPVGPGLMAWGGDVLAFTRTAGGSGDTARDVARLAGFADWRSEVLIGPGLLLGARGRIEIQGRVIGDDPAWPDTLVTTLPAAQVSLRWPLSREDAGGGTQILEPRIALGWSGAFGDAVPFEDSAISELDEGNLLSLGHFAGGDGHVTGASLTIGASWTRIGPDGGSISLGFGRILRSEAQGGFSATSGLDGDRSDWLVAAGLDLVPGLSFQARTLLSSNWDFGKTEAALDWRTDGFGLTAGYVWLPTDLDEDRALPVSEWTLAGDWAVNESWAVRASGRYDIANDAPSRAGLGVVWSNECVTVDLSVSRRYTETDTADPTTSFGLSVALNGFSAGRATAAAASCRN